MTDRLSPQAATWTRPVREPQSVTDTPRWWREIADADEDTNPIKAAEYRLLADRLESFITLKGMV